MAYELHEKLDTHQIWSGIKQRCYNPKGCSYPNYGAKGVTMCDRWRYSFDNFHADMGFRPTKQHSIDRIDPTGNYEPDNCRWATPAEQGRNKRNPKMTVIEGVSYRTADLAKEYGIRQSTIEYRAAQGMPFFAVVYKGSFYGVKKKERIALGANKPRTHCRNGHEFSESNPEKRHCRICQKISDKKRRSGQA